MRAPWRPDVAKQVVAALLGPEHAMLGLALGAIVAVSVFVPTQTMVLRWSKRRFNPSSLDLEQLPERLRIWRERCDASEVAARALDVAMRALHASGGVLFARIPTGRALLASRSADGDDAATILLTAGGAAASGGRVVDLEDEDGLAGWLILAPRADGSRFPQADLDALAAAAAAPLAKALRIAAPAHQRETAVLNVIDELQQRLARLEQKDVRPA